MEAARRFNRPWRKDRRGIPPAALTIQRGGVCASYAASFTGILANKSGWEELCEEGCRKRRTADARSPISGGPSSLTLRRCEF